MFCKQCDMTCDHHFCSVKCGNTYAATRQLMSADMEKVSLAGKALFRMRHDYSDVFDEWNSSTPMVGNMKKLRNKLIRLTHGHIFDSHFQEMNFMVSIQNLMVDVLPEDSPIKDMFYSLSHPTLDWP